MKNIELTLCHQKPERSFFWNGKQFPMCARCTGIHIGYLSMPFFLFEFVYIDFWPSLLLVLPTYIDGTLQAFLNWESTNFRRVTTGFLAGIGTMSLVNVAGYHFGKYILTLL